MSEPDIRSAAQARAYASELRGILVATGASDGRMEEGSMRIDANVSVRPVGRGEFGTRCEIKNLNSLRSLGRAIEYEVARQIALIEAGESVRQETRHWDEAAGRTESMRSKEEANDYRYFPEPDLVPLVPDAAWQERVRAGHGPDAGRPAGRAGRARSAARPARPKSIRSGPWSTSDSTGWSWRRSRPGHRPRLALARAANEVAAEGEAGLALPADVVRRAARTSRRSGALSATQSKAVLNELVAAGGGDPAALAKEMGFEALGADTLAAVVADVVAAHPDEWERYVEGDDKLSGVLHRGGHEGDQGAGQRQGSGGRAPAAAGSELRSS